MKMMEMRMMTHTRRVAERGPDDLGKYALGMIVYFLDISYLN
jgi:hypothetical protein